GVAPRRLDVAPERGDLVQNAIPAEHADRAVLDADRHGAAEQAADVARAGAGREVPVAGNETEHRVANRSTDRPRLVPRVLEPPGDLSHCVGRVEIHARPSYATAAGRAGGVTWRPSRAASATEHRAAVDVEDLTRDVSREIAAQEGDRPRHVLR